MSGDEIDIETTDEPPVPISNPLQAESFQQRKGTITESVQIATSMIGTIVLNPGSHSIKVAFAHELISNAKIVPSVVAIRRKRIEVVRVHIHFKFHSFIAGTAIQYNNHHQQEGSR